MEYAKILKILAPRVLNCAKCIGFADGDIKKQAGDIKKLLGSFDSYAERWIKGNTLMKQKGINPSCSTRVLESR